MKNNSKGIIIIIVILLIAVTLYYFLIYKNKNAPGSESSADNFKMLQDNLGIKTSTERLTVKFNEGKNQADFYNNNRMAIGKIGTAGYIVKGTYSNGGKTIMLDNGRVLNSESVWSNIEQTII